MQLRVPDGIAALLFDLDGVLTQTSKVHMAAWKKHLGLYPLPPMDDELAARVEPYRGAKDAMQLRYDRPVPYDLVERVVGVLLEQRRTGHPS